MRKIKFAILGLFCFTSMIAQINNPGNNSGGNSEESTDTAPVVPLKVTSWKVNPLLGNVTLSPMDTLSLNYQNNTVLDGEGYYRGYTGPMGSPTFSRYIFDQEVAPAFLFMKPYMLYNYNIENTRFYNATVPLSNLTYFNSGTKQDSEDYFKAFFTVNAGPKINFGGDFDLIYAKGFYNNNTAKQTHYRLFGSYVSDHYSIYGAAMSSNMSNKENGGILSDAYILDPASIDPRKKKFKPRDIPTNLANNYTRVISDQYFFTQRYNLGFERELRDSVAKKDTVVFVPVTSFIHTFDFQKNFKRYVMNEAPVDSNFYDNYYFNKDKFTDFTRNWRLSNTIGISLREGFNRFMKFGLTGYAQFTTERYELMNPKYILAPENQKGAYRDVNRYTESTLYVGGQLLKTQGKALTFDVNARFGVVGHNAGDVDIRGNIGSTFPLFGKDFYIDAEGYFLNKAPNFYYDQWISNNFIWNNSFKFEQRFRALAEIGLKQWDFSLKAGVENITNYIYFNEKSMPVQNSGSVQVLTGTLVKNFAFGPMHLDNEVTYQMSSDQKVMPLPELMLYHNLYFNTAIAKVLKIQIGADLRYWSSYYSPTFQPATNMFYNQHTTKVGNYPMVNVYINFNLKRARFFVMAYNVNEGLFGGNRYFALPNYPMSPRLFKFGLSWNFLN